MDKAGLPNQHLKKTGTTEGKGHRVHRLNFSHFASLHKQMEEVMNDCLVGPGLTRFRKPSPGRK